MHLRQAILITDQHTHTLQAGKSNSFDEIFADFQVMESDGGTRYSVFLHPKHDVTIRRLELQFHLPEAQTGSFFANGFQSWSESRLLGPDEYYPPLRAFARRFMGNYGDEHIPDIPHKKGRQHSWTYTYVTRSLVSHPGDQDTGVQFFASLNESTGFTLFLFDRANSILTVRKDMDGLKLAHSFPALDCWAGDGNLPGVFDQWRRLMDIEPPAAAPAVGWTSWYRHFTRISEAGLLRDLDAFASLCDPGDDENQVSETQTLRRANEAVYFQIDDGWQTKVGDWLSVKPEFPNGMGFLARKIREKSMSPGIWLAPFVAAHDSAVVRAHPDWLLRDKKGRPLKVGWNPMWGGWYFALDFYNNDVRNHLGGVFHLILEQWGYDLVKLDFLFAVCLSPPSGKTRGQVMSEAMEFLRKLTGRKQILACGVPLGAAIGQADYCRIGGDIHLSWEHRLLDFLRMRERVSTLSALRSTLGRWQLNGRFFQNDPDVFILRDENQHLTLAQQQTVLTINVLLGSLLFTSDDAGRYSPEQKAELESAFDLRGSTVSVVQEVEKDVYQIMFTNSGERYVACCNLNDRPAGVQIQNGRMELQPFETVILKG
ncbi:MAG: alpha-galactosidase [Lewinellaceae bacterium]|nr:alpha-galactosidase [Lewinellaceae bacterium]